MSISKLYFGKSAPLPLETKWPKIAENKVYQAIKGNIPSCTTVADDYGEYLFLDSAWDSDQNGLAWDINANVAYNGMQNVHKDTQVRWISSMSMTHYYCLTYKSESLVIAQYEFCKCISPESCTSREVCTRVRDCHGMGPLGPNGECLSPEETTFYPICKKGDKSLFVQRSPGEGECTPISWKVFNGFVNNGTVYLFAEDHVWSFAQSAYDSPAPVTFKGQKWSSFIECGSKNGARDSGASKRKWVKARPKSNEAL